MSAKPPSFSEASREKSNHSLSEFWLFIRNNKKWWLTPIIIVMLMVSALVMLSGTGAAPFIYSLF